MPKIKTVDVNEKTVILNLECGRIINHRKVDSGLVETDIDPNMLTISVDLFDAPELRACQNFQAQLKAKIMRYVVPSFLRGGMYRVKHEAVDIVDGIVTQAEADFVPLVQAFADVVEQRRDESQERLKNAFDPTAYPSRSKILAQYRIEHEWLMFSTPDSLKSINKDIFSRERDKAAAQVEVAAQKITALLAAEAKELGDHLVSRLSTDEDGKPKQIRKSAVKNIREFLDTFKFRNIGTSEELEEQIKRIDSLTAGLDVKDLKSNEKLREDIAKSFKEVTSTLDSLIVSKPTRYMAKGEDQ